MPNVSNIVKTIQDIMRKDAGTYGDAQRLEQLGWMFFLKIFDDREKELELLRDAYRSPLPAELRWSTWAADDEGITGEPLLDFVNNTLLSKLKALTGGTGDKLTPLIRTTFEDANNYMKNGTLMRQVINKISGIDFNASDDRHMFGDIYEKLLKDLQSAGNAGEFYTPRAVTQFIVEQVNPRLDKHEIILDPACGTGGFLTCAIEYLRKQAKTEADERFIQDCFAGIEKKHLPHVLCMTNLLLHGIDIPSNVRHDNTLARPLRDWSPRERVDVIVTNPPFGGMEEDGIEANFPAEFRTRETADLFLVLLMKILKPGGRAGLVLPDGTLFGEGVKTRIKEELLRECNLHTIVRLPNGVFNPYTGIRTNLLFFTKGQPTTEVWYYEHPYPPGAKSYNKGKPIRIEEFEPERAWWGDETNGFAGRVENEQAWRVSIDQIKAGNYNLDLKNPHVSDTGPGDLDHLLPEYEKLLAQIAATRAELKAQLQEALTRSMKAEG
ncbi:MAG: type I restriction-modification system subunit M [Syntrophobacterales bacterium]|nr:type I restriction-modification system subunit M [Syntrophobacterales bacterium]